MANFTQAEITQIQNTVSNILARMCDDGEMALNSNDKPIAEGYAMMARLLQRLVG